MGGVGGEFGESVWTIGRSGGISLSGGIGSAKICRIEKNNLWIVNKENDCGEKGS